MTYPRYRSSFRNSEHPKFALEYNIILARVLQCRHKSYVSALSYY